MSEDDALMEKVRTGDRVAFDSVVRRHQDRLQRFATRMAGGDSARGADIAVGAFVRLWESRTGFAVDGKTEAWLLQTAYRLFVDDMRRTKPSHELIEHDAISDSPHIPVEKSALAQAVRDAVTSLPESHRAVIILSAYEDLTQAEIAKVLDIPPGTVASRKAQAYETLRRRLVAWREL